MNIARQNTTRTFDRRTILRGALAAAAVVPLGSALAACAGGGSDDDSDSDTKGGTKSADNPFGMADELHRRRGHLQRRLRHRLRGVRGRAHGEEPRRVHGEGVPDDRDRPGAAAPVRRRRPARPDRQLRGERDRVQHDPRPARGPRRRPRRQQPRGHEDPRHPVRRRGGAGHLRRQARGPELRPDGLRRLVLRQPVRGVRLDPADDVGRGDRPRRQGQGEGQVPLPLGQGGRDLLPDAGDRVGDQGGRRRGPPRSREPAAGLLVASRGPGRLRGDGRDRLGRLRQAGRLGHPVHRRPGPVEQRPGRAALPVRLVDRERDEGPDQGAASR